MCCVLWLYQVMGFPGGSDSKESACNAEDLGLIPGSERSPEKEMATHSNIFAWRIPWAIALKQATVHGVAETWTGLKD